MKRSDDWFDYFWSGIEFDEDDGDSSIRLLGDLLDSEAIRRDGDDLVGRASQRIRLTPEDQYLIRRIERAVAAANESCGTAS